MPSKKLTTYKKCDLRDDVKLHLPDDWELQVYKIVSGDSGKEYWVQYLRRERKWSGTENIILCDCPEGKFKAPLIVLGLSDFICKHGRGLLAFLKEKEENQTKKT